MGEKKKKRKKKKRIGIKLKELNSAYTLLVKLQLLNSNPPKKKTPFVG